MRNAIVAGSLLMAATVYTVSLCGPTTPKKKKPETMSTTDKPATLMGREIEDKCACGEEVKPYQRQDMGYNPETGKWRRICEKCLMTKPKEKLTNGLAAV